MVSTEPTTPVDEEIDLLIRTCRTAAAPSHDLIIAGEGNASLTTAEGTLYVTASGSRLSELTRHDLVRVDRDLVLAGIDEATDDRGWQRIVQQASGSDRRPTVEVALHAVISTAAGPGVVLHTHPTSVLAVMAQGRGRELATTRLFPDHIVMCGPTSSYLPYIDPGHELARQLATSGPSFVRSTVLYLDSHGIVVSAPSASGALDITLMASKAARILLTTVPESVHELPTEAIMRISERDDEKARQQALGLRRSDRPG